MSRSIPSALQTHLNGSVTSTCRLLRITLTDGREFGLTTLDRDVTYDGTTYSAINGFDTSMIATDAGLSVDNAEASALLSADIPGITLEMAERGELDDAQWLLMLVNWADLTMGHVVLDAGDIGEVRTIDDTVYMPELLSYAARLRQPIGHVWSRTCRAIFGTPANSQTGCGVDTDYMWESGTVTGLGDEPRRVFADSSLDLDPAPVPGRVQWVTGNNASNRLFQVEAYSNVSGTIALLEPTHFDIEVGDEFIIRPDCPKTPEACKFYNNWVNYKGEPLIPVGDGAAIMAPGGSIPGGISGSEIVD